MKMSNKTIPTLSIRGRRCSKNLKMNSGTTGPKKIVSQNPTEKTIIVEKREVRSRNAKTKAVLGISSTIEEPSEKVKKAVQSNHGKNKTVTEKPNQSPTNVSLTQTEQRLMNGNSSINSFKAQADFILANKRSCSNGPSNPARKPMYVVIVMSELTYPEFETGYPDYPKSGFIRTILETGTRCPKSGYLVFSILAR